MRLDRLHHILTGAATEATVATTAAATAAFWSEATGRTVCLEALTERLATLETRRDIIKELCAEGLQVSTRSRGEALRSLALNF
jgi:hypothetical protein